MNLRTNEEWCDALQSQGEVQANAIADLREFLLRACLYSVSHRIGSLNDVSHYETQQLAEDSAQDALLAILKHLPEFRSDSKFTTWAYKFAVNFSLMAARHQRWKEVSLDRLMEDTNLPESSLLDGGPSDNPALLAQQTEVWVVLKQVIETDLTQRQQQVLKAMVFDEVPLDEIAQHFESNRNAIYKLMHDARQRLKTRLEQRGFKVPEIMDMFSARR
ncbi:MAG TPA: sigma-70 family RNA polymerase sigma factor [Anaerolineae bacterium]|jgi:RNA polymerase sigma-70 factor (ECF subfamily)